MIPPALIVLWPLTVRMLEIRMMENNRVKTNDPMPPFTKGKRVMSRVKNIHTAMYR